METGGAVGVTQPDEHGSLDLGVVMEVVKNRWIWEIFQGRVPRIGDAVAVGHGGEGCQGCLWISGLRTSMVVALTVAGNAGAESSCRAEHNFGFGHVGFEGGAEVSSWRC